MADNDASKETHNSRKRRASIPAEHLWLEYAYFTVIDVDGDRLCGGCVNDLLDYQGSLQQFHLIARALKTARLRKIMTVLPSEYTRDKASLRLSSMDPKMAFVDTDGALYSLLMIGHDKSLSHFVFQVHLQTDALPHSDGRPTPVSHEPSTTSTGAKSDDLAVRDATVDEEVEHEDKGGDEGKRNISDGDDPQDATMEIDEPGDLYTPPSPKPATDSPGGVIILDTPSPDHVEHCPDPMDTKESDGDEPSPPDPDCDAQATDGFLQDMIGRDEEFSNNALASIRLRTWMDNHMIQRFCQFFNVPPNEFDPAAGMTVSGIRTTTRSGARKLPNTYQVFTAFFMAHHEAEHTVDGHELGKISFGGTVAHDPGLGKTLCAIIAWVLNLKLVLMDREVKRDRALPAQEQKHLPSSAPVDSQCQYGRHRYGTECLCEHNTVAETLNYFNGSTVASVKATLVPTWLTEFLDSVDREYLDPLIKQDQKACGVTVLSTDGICLVNAHSAKTPEGAVSNDDFFNVPESLYCFPGCSAKDWEAINGGKDGFDEHTAIALKEAMSTQPEETIASLLRGDLTFGDRVLRSPVPVEGYEYLLPAAAMIITSYLCLNTRVLASAVLLLEKMQLSFDCDRQDCQQCSAKPFSEHKYDTPELKRSPLQFHRLLIDEAHNIQNKGSEYHKSIAGMIKVSLRQQLHAPAIWLFTGTPWSSSPFDLVGYLNIQQSHWRETEWRNLLKAHPNLKLLIDSDMDQARKEFKAMSHLQDDAEYRHKLSASEGDEIRGIYEERTMAVVDALLNLIIKIKCTDEWKGHSIAEIPKRADELFSVQPSKTELRDLQDFLVHAQQSFRAKTTAKAVVDAHAAAQGKSKDSRKIRQDSSADYAKAVRRATTSYMALSMAQCFLNIHAIGKMQVNGASEGTCRLSAYIQEHGLYDREDGNPYFDHRQALLDQGPKARALAEEYRAMADVDIPLDGSRPNGKGRKGTLKSRPQIIVAVKVPSVACALLHALRLSLQDKLSTEQIVAFHAGLSSDERQDVISRFQQRQSRSKDIKILVLCVEVGGEGITSTKADAIFHFDVEPSWTTFEQTSSRASRLGRRFPLRNVQMVLEFAGIDMARLQKRRRQETRHKDLLEKEGTRAGEAVEAPPVADKVTVIPSRERSSDL